ncbi:lytic transglycosylase domain-containing protein [Geomonas sp. RF6]|uniref:lytic transglycosylase domain-containing protein n=1 Tax=Geomonas sp. RF6 TaxID=2897342 RepID=UPI002ED887F6
MSINPIEPRQTFDVTQPKGHTTPSAAQFEEALESAGRGSDGKANPELAAEILRVKMLGSALALGNDGGTNKAAAPSATMRALDNFLANLAKGETGGSVASAVGESGEAPAEGIVEGIDPGAGRGAATGADDVIEKASRHYGVDRALIRAVIKAESGFNPRAVSSAGAQGLMQLMPSTAKMLGVRDSFDPEQNVMAGTRFLKDLLQRYGGDVDSALAAYNWGPGNLERSTGTLPRETRDYLRKVKGYYAEYTA